MVSICCILFNSNSASSDSSPDKKSSKKTSPNKRDPKKCWESHKDHFLCALIRCAGRRHALGIDSSGCESSRGTSSGRTTRSASFNEWDASLDQERRGSSSSYQFGKRVSTATVEDHATALRPMITLFAALDQLSK